MVYGLGFRVFFRSGLEFRARVWAGLGFSSLYIDGV